MVVFICELEIKKEISSRCGVYLFLFFRVYFVIISSFEGRLQCLSLHQFLLR